jgi:5-methylcytosine-specific restriction endonuclease McrA
MNKSVKTLFPQTEDGHCSVCKEEITDSRKQRYCSDHCKDVAYATMRFFRWQSVRKRVLEEREKVCQRCGYDPEEAEKQVEQLEDKLKDKYEVVDRVYSKKRQLEVDHIKPVAKEGKVFDPDNLQILCDKCNRKKSDKWNGKKNLEDFYEIEKSGDLREKQGDSDV